MIGEGDDVSAPGDAIAVDEDYSELELAIFRKTAELNTLRNRLRRYWHRLAFEAITIAKAEGIISEVVHMNDLPDHVLAPEASSRIPLYVEGEGVNADILLKLASSKFPSLFRKYIHGKDRYEKGLEDLQNLVDSAT